MSPEKTQDSITSRGKRRARPRFVSLSLRDRYGHTGGPSLSAVSRFSQHQAARVVAFCAVYGEQLIPVLFVGERMIMEAAFLGLRGGAHNDRICRRRRLGRFNAQQTKVSYLAVRSVSVPCVEREDRSIA